MLCFRNKLIRLSSHTKIFIAQQYYVKNKLRVWARRNHHEAFPSILSLLFYIKPDGGHIVSDHVYLLYTCRIFHHLVKRKIMEGNVWYKMCIWFYLRLLFRKFLFSARFRERYYNKRTQVFKQSVGYLCFTLTLRRLMSYIYEAPILDVSRSHTTTQHSR